MLLSLFRHKWSLWSQELGWCLTNLLQNSTDKIAVTAEKLPDQSESSNHQKNYWEMKAVQLVFVSGESQNLIVVYACFGIFWYFYNTFCSGRADLIFVSIFCLYAILRWIKILQSMAKLHTLQTQWKLICPTPHLPLTHNECKRKRIFSSIKIWHLIWQLSPPVKWSILSVHYSVGIWFFSQGCHHLNFQQMNYHLTWSLIFHPNFSIFFKV